jgi:hypothetical protein
MAVHACFLSAGLYHETVLATNRYKLDLLLPCEILCKHYPDGEICD